MNKTFDRELLKVRFYIEIIAYDLKTSIYEWISSKFIRTKIFHVFGVQILLQGPAWIFATQYDL